jgi:hypothetical protein
VVGLRKRGEEIRQFILENVAHHPTDIVTWSSETLGISRQAVNKHVQKLVLQKALLREGTTRNRRYSLGTIELKEFTYALDGRLQEDLIWRNDVAPIFADLPDNVRAIWQYGFTEMLNNAIDHSSGTLVTVQIQKTLVDSAIMILDNGEGIFKKIRRELNLDDEHHAVLELAKGKLTTDPDRHTGEGIFFTSRMFDHFTIDSGSTSFDHTYEDSRDWIMEPEETQPGTAVYMVLRNNTARTTKEIFDSFASEDDDYGFTKTVVPVRLAQYGQEELISRSQAKRLLARIDRFKTVVFDFKDVEAIGPAFADEVFRVFPQQYSGIEIVPINGNPDVMRMIARAEKGKDPR